MKRPNNWWMFLYKKALMSIRQVTCRLVCNELDTLLQLCKLVCACSYVYSWTLRAVEGLLQAFSCMGASRLTLVPSWEVCISLRDIKINQLLQNIIWCKTDCINYCNAVWNMHHILCFDPPTHTYTDISWKSNHNIKNSQQLDPVTTLSVLDTVA